MMMIKELFKATKIIAVGRLLNIITQFTFNVLLTKYLTKNDVGDFFLVFSMINFFSMLITFGAGNIALKQFSERFNNNIRKPTLQLFVSYLLMGAFTSFIVICIFLIFSLSSLSSYLKLDLSAYQMGLMTTLFVSTGLQIIFTDIFRSAGQFVKMTATSGFIVNVLNLSALVIHYSFSDIISLNDVFLIVTFNTLLNALLSTALVVKTCKAFDKAQKNGNTILEFNKLVIDSINVIGLSAPSFINKFGLYLILVADIWLLSAFFNKSIVADYAVAVKLSMLSSLFLLIANGFIPTFLGKLNSPEHGNNHSEYKTDKKGGRKEIFLRTISTFVFIPSCFIFAGLYLYSDVVIVYIFDSRYILSIVFLKVLLIGQIVTVMVGSCSYTLVMEGKNIQLMNASLFSGGLSILLAYLFLYAGFGSISIAWSFTLGSISRSIAIYLMANKLCGINTATYLNPFLFYKSCKKVMTY